MSIIDRIKKEAATAVQQYLQNIDQAEDEESAKTIQTPQTRCLIQEISSLDVNDHQQSRQKYQQQQFQYFAKVTTNKLKCIVCKKINPKYTCPKCKVPYCSIDHYKSHNLFCTERFFKEQVESQLKSMKASSQDRKNMVEMLRSNREQCEKDSTELENEVKIQQISEERLVKILEKLEKQEDVELTENETKAFQAYLKDIQYHSMHQSQLGQKDSEQEAHPFRQSTPFWLIEQGLSLYFGADQYIEIQYYNQSQHKQLLDYRQFTAQLLREELPKLLQTINFKKTSVFVNFELIQMVYLTALLFRAYNGEYIKSSEFGETFFLIYDESFAKRLSEVQLASPIDIMKSELSVIGCIKSNIVKVQGNKPVMEILQGWMPLVLEDCRKIFQNKFLCLQSLVRLQEGLKSLSTDQGIKWSDQVMQAVKSQKPARSKEERARQRKILKVVKKIQFLICYVSDVVYREPVQKAPEGDIEAIRTLNNKAIIMSAILQGLQSQKKSQNAQQSLHDLKQAEKQRKLKGILVP